MGEAVKIVDLETEAGVPFLDFLAVKRIINSRGTQGLPTIILSINGVARSGKSFLLNLMVNYLQYVETNGTHVGWESSNERVEGINWAQSRTAVTRGIWMWNKPYRVRRKDGSEVAVLLMDTQGTNDNTMSDPKLDTTIMHISLELSSFQLLNIQSYLTSTELTSLQLCADYADLTARDDEAAAAHEETNLFENLVFVVRNYQGDDQEPGERPHLFQELEGGTNPNLLKAVKGIKRAFGEITSYAFPYPGAEIANASVTKKEWTLKDIPEDFLNTTKSLCVYAFDSINLKAIKMPTGTEQLEKFKLLKAQLESSDRPDIGTPSASLQQTVLNRAYTKAIAQYRKSLDGLKLTYLQFGTESDLQTALNKLESDALIEFGQSGFKDKYENTPIWLKHEHDLRDKVQDYAGVTLGSYVKEKKIAQQVETNRKLQLQNEERQREKAREMKRLEEEATKQAARLVELQRIEKEKEKARQLQLEKVQRENQIARDQERARQQREADRLRRQMEAERAAREEMEKRQKAEMDKMKMIQSFVEQGGVEISPGVWDFHNGAIRITL